MTWSLSPERKAGLPVWVKRLGDVYLSVYRSCETHTQWKWKVQYGIATAIGYAKTVRAAKIRATRVAKQYADQFDVQAFLSPWLRAKCDGTRMTTVERRSR